MIRWWAIALMLLLVSCAVLRGREHSTPTSIVTPTAQVAVAPTPSPQLVPPQNAPKVDQQQLWTHLQALTGERYTQLERDRVRKYLIQTLKTAGWSVTTQSFPTGTNVIARQPQKSTTTGTMLVVAHYDTVEGSPGADDNATGVVAALEVARLLKNHPSPYALAIVLFDQEEQGLVGSLAFTANSANITNVIGVINLEMLGYTCNTPGCQRYPAGLPINPPSDRGDFLGIVGDQEHAHLLQAFQLAHNASLPPIITVPIPFKGMLTPDVLRSDHAPFWARNIGAVMMSDTANFRNPHYHKPSDTLDTVDFTFLTRATQLVVNATVVLLDQTN
jgi:Zn-dependent M28 family amino/carboxypeptidase